MVGVGGGARGAWERLTDDEQLEARVSRPGFTPASLLGEVIYPSLAPLHVNMGDNGICV